jgi:hypothetical protein
MLKKIIYSLLFCTIFLGATIPDLENVTKLYVATFQRAPDSDGLNYWVKQSVLPLEGVAQSFFDQKETKELYPFDYGNDKFIDRVYRNLFNRIPDVEGKRYWLEALESGRVDRSVFILAVINGARGDDITILENKTVVGLAFANAQMSDIDDARGIMSNITADESSIDDALKRYGLISDSDREEDPSPATVKPKPISVVSQKGWYIRISTQSSGLEDDQTVIGYLEGASDRRDRYDNEAFPSSGLYTSIYHNNFGKKSDFRSDYRAYKEVGSRSESWIIKVNNARHKNSDVTISWSDIIVVEKRPKVGYSEREMANSTILQYMRLIDEEGGNIVDISQDSSYSFNMNGKSVRELRWVILADGEDEPTLSARGE